MTTYEFSENLQRGIIYLIKSNNDFFVEANPLIKPDYFELPIHVILVRIISDYHSEYGLLPTDEIIVDIFKTVKSEKDDISSIIDELEYINSLDLETIGNKDYLLDAIEKFAKTEAIKNAIKDSVVLLKQNKIDEIEELIRRATLVNRNVDLGEYYTESEYKDRWNRMFNQETAIIHPTILPKLNEALHGGTRPGEVMCVAALPGVGKSLFLSNEAVNLSKLGFNVLLITLENGQDYTGLRNDAIITGMSIDEMVKEESVSLVDLKKKEFQKLHNTGNIIIKEFSESININHIRSLLVQLKNHKGFVPDVILVDYLELMSSVQGNLAEYLAQEKISRELVTLAKETKTSVRTATQPNREGSKVDIIKGEHMADSYGKIRPLHILVTLNQSADEHDQGKMRAWVEKARNGKAKFIIPMDVNYSNFRMSQSTGGFDPLISTTGSEMKEKAKKLQELLNAKSGRVLVAK